MSQDQQTFRQAALAALFGLLTQLVLGIGMAVLGVFADSAAIQAATWHLFGGLPIWLILLIIFHQHRLERLEALETEQLAQADARTAAIFDEAGQQLQVARQRLETLYKFGLPIVSIIVAVYLLVIGLLQLYVNWGALTGGSFAQVATADRSAIGFILVLVLVFMALGAFLVSRYVSGMTQMRDWSLLRGGASYLMGNAFVAVLLVAGTVSAYAEIYSVLAVMAIVVPAFMSILGLEMLLGFLLSIYRPRRPGEVMRPAFDSRILGWLTRPESIGKIISETLNYQFGFEISRSWFYQLLARAITPLIVIGMVVLIGLTSVVIVEPYQEAVITTFGADPRIVKPGAHLKWPWPVGQARKEDVYRVKQIMVGAVDDNSAQQADAQKKDQEKGLWGVQHAADEQSQYLLTAAPTFGSADKNDTAASELIGANRHWLSHL